jgi:hypothetical protein
MKSLNIFRAGRHTAMSGATIEFTAADLIAVAAAYDPAKYEAPLVVGHPKLDKPRFGGVGSLTYADGMLSAGTKDVVPEFAEWVNRKLFNQVSASFYTPDSPQNPTPGVYSLRHVGFLGAQPPAIKGLNPNGISFSEAEVGVIEFADWGKAQNASLWRRMRDWMIGEKGLEVADSILPDYAIGNMEQDAQSPSEAPGPAGISYSETPNQGDEMSAEEKAQLATALAENAKLKKEAEDFAEAQAKATRTALNVAHVAFADGLIAAGKLLPAHKALVVSTLDHMSAPGAVVEFGEGTDKKPLLDAYKAMLEAQPKLVEFGEIAGGAAQDSVVNFAAPAGHSVSSDLLEVHSKALAHQSAHPGIDYLAAVKAVS